MIPMRPRSSSSASSSRGSPPRGGSWQTTSEPSAAAWTSSSTKSAPSSIARSKAGSVFSGYSHDAPRCAITQVIRAACAATRRRSRPRSRPRRRTARAAACQRRRSRGCRPPSPRRRPPPCPRRRAHPRPATPSASSASRYDSGCGLPDADVVVGHDDAEQVGEARRGHGRDDLLARGTRDDRERRPARRRSGRQLCIAPGDRRAVRNRSLVAVDPLADERRDARVAGAEAGLGDRLLGEPRELARSSRAPRSAARTRRRGRGRCGRAAARRPRACR